MEFRQCSDLVGCNGTCHSIVNDTGLGENFIVDSAIVTVQTADGDLPPNWNHREWWCTVFPRNLLRQ